MNQSRSRRTLSAETLEGRHLLHGGGFGAAMGGGAPPEPDEVAAAIVDRLDANDDGTIVAEEVSERMWSRLSAADADGDNALTAGELGAQIESALADRQGQRLGGVAGRGFGGMRGGGRSGFRGGHGRFDGGETTVEERVVSLYERVDANMDGFLTEDEVSERHWSRIAEADLNGDGVSQQELIDKLNADREARVDAAIDRLFEADANGDGLLTEDEVSARKWSRISEADSDEDDDDGVSADELRDFIESRHSGEDTDEGDDGDEGEEEPQPAVASNPLLSRSFTAARRGGTTSNLVSFGARLRR